MENQPEYKTEPKYPRKVDWTTYKFRCSMLGELMPGTQAKPGQLQKTEVSALRKIWNKAVWGITEEIKTDPMEKGTIQESIGIDLIQKKYYAGKFIAKNTKRFPNDYLTGEPDIIVREFDKIHDNKCAWTFRTFRDAKMTKSNELQIRGYLWLLEMTNGQVDYTLVNSPESMILKYQVYKFMDYGIYVYDWRDSDPETLKGYIDEACFQNPEIAKEIRQIRHNMTFDYVPDDLRVKSFELKRDESFELQIRDRALLWRSELAKMEL